MFTDITGSQRRHRHPPDPNDFNVCLSAKIGYYQFSTMGLKLKVWAFFGMKIPCHATNLKTLFYF
jgi:hypothetical protein